MSIHGLARCSSLSSVVWMILASSCGHYGIDLEGSSAVDASRTANSEATSGSDGSGEASRPSDSTSPGQKPHETSATTGGSESGGASSASVPPDSSALTSVGSETKKRPTDEELDAGALDASLDSGWGTGPHNPDASADGAVPEDSTEQEQLDGGNEGCAPGCECALNACNLTCLTEQCLVRCQTECRVEVGDAEYVTLECKPGAVCETKEMRALEVDVTCSGGGECRTECREGQHCTISCEGDSKCVASCRAGAQCDMVCTGNAQCYLAYEEDEDARLSCVSGGSKYCGEELKTCSDACPQ